MSADFYYFSNTYFFADSLASFNDGEGMVKWKRYQLMPRQAFTANTYLHQPLKNLDFPDTAYDNDPELYFSIQPINDRCLRIRMLTTPVKTPELESIMLVGEPEQDLSQWNITQDKESITYASNQGSLIIQKYPWRLILKDKEGKVLTQTRCWSDNDSTQIKVAPFSFIKRGSDNTRSMNPVFSLSPGEKIYGCGESPTQLNKAGQKVNLFVTDPQGPEGLDMYKPIPFFLSSRSEERRVGKEGASMCRSCWVPHHYTINTRYICHFLLIGFS